MQIIISRTESMNNIPNITEEWLSTPNNQLGEKLLAGYTDPQSVQERLLTEILQSASHCEIGKKFDFNSIHSIQEFQQRMPLTDWHDVEPYSDKMVEGAEDLLFPGRT